MKSHDEEHHNSFKTCPDCDAIFSADTSHKCIKFVLSIIKEVVGVSALDKAIRKLNSKAKASITYEESDHGIVEGMLSQQISNLESVIQTSLNHIEKRSRKSEDIMKEQFDATMQLIQ
jgi:hypothetical protein